MKDNEIIKALECCAVSRECGKCPAYEPTEQCITTLQKNALDLINRQKADNERLQKLLEEEEAKFKECAKRFYKVGVNDFAERLKGYYIKNKIYDKPNAHTLIGFLFYQIDTIVEEKVGAENV